MNWHLFIIFEEDEMQSFAAIHACLITQMQKKGLEVLYFLAPFCLAALAPQVLIGKHLGSGSSCP